MNPVYAPVYTPVYAPWLVVLSLVMAFQGSYIGLHLTRKIRASSGERLRSLVAMSTLFMALAIWTTHFLGMLALRVPTVIDFLVLPGLIAFMICALVTGLSIFIVSEGPPTLIRIGLASVLLGAGIAGTYYIGVLALHTNAIMTSEPVFVVAGVLLGILVSMIALWLALTSNSWSTTWSAGVVMTVAISAMHYTAAAGMRVVGSTTTVILGPVLSQEALAIVVSVIAFIVSAMFLLTLVPEVAKAQHDDRSMSDVEVSQSKQSAEELPDSCVPRAEPSPTQTFPVEKDGRRNAISVDTIVAIQAQAHYTSIFDGKATWFCPLSISEIESMLDSSLFARIHRSHIVNLDRVAFSSRSGDLVATLTPVDHKVPVSRSRRGWLKEMLQQRASFRN